MRKRAILAILLILALTGCPGSNWDKAAALADDFAHSVETAQTIEIDAFHQGLISKEDHVAVEKVFMELAKDGQTLDNAIRTGQSSKNITQAFQAALTITNDALSTADTRIKHPDTKAKIQIVLTAAKGLLDTMKALK